MKRTLSLILALLMLLSAFLAVACAEDTGTTEESDTKAEGSETVAETEAETQRSDVSDNLPENTYDGADFNILTYYKNESWFKMTEEEAEDVLDESIYKRNDKVEQRFDIKLTYKGAGDSFEYWDCSQAMQQSIASDEDIYDAYINHVIQTGIDTANFYFQDMTKADYIDFDQPWWCAVTEDLSYNGVVLFAIGSYDMTALGNTYGIAYNKGIGADYGVTDDLIELVNNKTWTVEKMNSYIKDVYYDFNGDSQKDADDIYGLVLTGRGTSEDSWFFSLGGKNCEIEKDGTITTTFMSEWVTDFVQWFYDLTWDAPYCYTDFETWNLGSKRFVLGKTMFAETTFNLYSQYKEVSGLDYMLLPYPMWTEEEGRYYSCVDAGHTAQAIPITVKDTEYSSIILEALNAESWKLVVPAFYDITLKTKTAGDDTEAEMIDLIANCRVYDFGYYYGQWCPPHYAITDAIKAKDTNFVSIYESNYKSKWLDVVEIIGNTFDEYTK